MKVTRRIILLLNQDISEGQKRDRICSRFLCSNFIFYVYRYRTTSTPVSSKAKAMEQVNSRAYNFRKYERYKMSTHRLTPEINYHEFSIYSHHRKF